MKRSTKRVNDTIAYVNSLMKNETISSELDRDIQEMFECFKYHDNRECKIYHFFMGETTGHEFFIAFKGSPKGYDLDKSYNDRVVISNKILGLKEAFEGMKSFFSL